MRRPHDIRSVGYVLDNTVATRLLDLRRDFWARFNGASTSTHYMVTESSVRPCTALKTPPPTPRDLSGLGLNPQGLKVSRK